MTATTAATKTRKGPAKLSPEHKQALALGRQQSKIVSDYLNALETRRPKRGRKVTRESLQQRLERIEAEIPTAKPLQRVTLVQEKMNLEERLHVPEESDDFPILEQRFQEVVADYSGRRGISYPAWVSAGVKPEILKAAGLDRKVKDAEAA